MNKFRSPRSPLARATNHQVEMLREMVTRILWWERMIVKRQVETPDFYGTKTVQGLAELTWYAERHNEVIRRAVGRLMNREDAKQIRENISSARYQRDNPAAYEVHLLRKNLTDGALDRHSFDEALGRIETALQR